MYTGTISKESSRSVHTESFNDSVDWRTKGVVPPVRNQGQCGSAAMFTVLDSVQAANTIKTGRSLQLSAQQLIDCMPQGCRGGWVDDYWKYVLANGLMSEQDYPSSGRQGTCGYDASKVSVKLSSVKNVTPDEVSTLEAAIKTEPTLVEVEADSLAFQTYSSGILSADNCGDRVNHTLLAVGYGTSEAGDFYILKNSWGASWGDSGYIKIFAKDGKGICGVQEHPSYPIE